MPALRPNSPDPGAHISLPRYMCPCGWKLRALASFLTMSCWVLLRFAACGNRVQYI